MRRWVVVLVLASGCGGGSARIGFSVPETLSASVASVRLRVVRPAGGDENIDCDAVAYAQVAGALLDGATEREVVINAAGATELGELTRDTRTLLVAEAFAQPAALGDRLAAGCVEVESIEGGDTIDIEGEPAVDLVGLDASFSAGIAVPADFIPDPLRLVINDARGAPVAGVTVRLSVLDVSGVPLTIERTSNGAGEVELATDFLEQRPIGAMRLVLRAPWQRASVSIDTASPPRVSLESVDGVLLSFAASASARAIYVVVDAGVGNAALARVVVAGDQATAGTLVALPTGFILLVRVPAATGELIAGLWDDGYRVLDVSAGTFGPLQALSTGILGRTATFALPSCGGSAVPLAFLAPGDDTSTLVALRAQGSGIAVAPTPSFVGTGIMRAAGCIRDAAGGLHRAVAMVSTAGAQELRIESVGVPLGLPASSSALALGTSEDPVLLAGVATTSGPQVRYYDLGGPASGPRLESEKFLVLGGDPRVLASTDLNGDGVLDLVALVGAGGSGQAFSVVYGGIQVEPPLSALFALPASTGGSAVPQPDVGSSGAAMVTLDGDGDGRVELWSLQSFISVPSPGPGPPGGPAMSTVIQRLDFAR